MDFNDTPAEAGFRKELRTWLSENMPATNPKSWGDRAELYEFARVWQKTLYEAGWLGLTWPREYGGRGASIFEQIIFLTEMARARAPEPLGVIGLNMAGPVIMAHGTPEQKKQHIKAILSGDQIFCQGFSEPGSGSDLAALTTKAIRDSDAYVVTGQKVWCSYAQLADYCILLTRSDPTSTGRVGLTYLIVDMKAKGVQVRPLRQITGDAEFNEIFFDAVRVPVSSRLADEGQGWEVAITTLLHERATLGAALQVRADVLLRDLRKLAAEVTNGEYDKRLAEFEVEAEALRLTMFRSTSAFATTGVPGAEGSILKLHWSELNQAMTEFALEILGPLSQVDGGRWEYGFLRSKGNTIEAGTSEILRNIIAERVLGLPRSR